MLCLSRAVATTSTHSATLAWDPVSEQSVVGYRLLIGTSSGDYTRSYNVGLATDFFIDGLDYGQTYHAVVISLGADGFESEPSTELVFTVAPPPLPFGAQVAFDASGRPLLQWSYSKAALGSSPEFVIQASADLQNWSVVETISADQPSADDGHLLKFVRPIEGSAPQMFYRITARNWMGESKGS